MSHSVVIGSGDQVVTYEIRSLVSEIENFRVADVAGTSADLEEAVLRRDPEVVLIHASLGPGLVLQTVQDLALRRPGAAIVLLTAQPTPEFFADAMDAGARGVLPYPPTLESLQVRLASAVGWATQMRRHLSAADPDAGHSAGRGRMVVVAGAKGGVGTSTVATHLAHHVTRSASGKSVCLVDLDLEKGDLSNLLGVTHRLDISDLAKVADDLGPQTIGSAIHRDGDGVGLLLAPAHIEDVGHVDERETRLILGAVRRHFDLVVVDAGAHVTPVSAAAVELADDVVLVTNPEVLALRGVHRTLDAWGRVNARRPDGVRVLLNRVSKVTSVQPEAAARLVPVAPMATRLPAAFKQLEPGLNHRTPHEVRDRGWWEGIANLTAELGLAPPPAEHGRRRGSRHRNPAAAALRADLDERGQASLEFVGVFPVILLLVVVVWQVALSGVALVMTGHAADEGARAVTVSEDVDAAARAGVPGWVREGMSVSSTADDVVVRTRIPILVPGVSSPRWTFSSRVGVVREP